MRVLLKQKVKGVKHHQAIPRPANLASLLWFSDFAVAAPSGFFSGRKTG
jgi:hypothetical protein